MSPVEATREDTESKLYDVAERQAGYFTASQALEAGYSHASQSYHHKAGNWLRDGWGIYRLAHFPHVAGEDFVRLMLWSRDRAGVVHAAISHASALRAYELSDVLPHETHVIVPKRFRKKAPDGVVLHPADLAPDDVRERDGYRITTPLRTLLDVAASRLSLEHLEAATSEALQRGLVRRRALEEAVHGAADEARKRFAFLGLPCMKGPDRTRHAPPSPAERRTIQEWSAGPRLARLDRRSGWQPSRTQDVVMIPFMTDS